MTKAATRPVDHLDTGPGGAAARGAGISKIYGTGDAAVVALDNVSLDLPRGRYTAGGRRPDQGWPDRVTDTTGLADRPPEPTAATVLELMKSLEQAPELAPAGHAEREPAR